MLCEKCGKNQANFYYKQTKNGHTTEKHLCSECASKMGLGFDFGGMFSYDDNDFFNEFLGGMFEQEKPKIVSASACPYCGTRLGELLQSGKVGCANCYKEFRNALMPTVRKIHGNVVHTGKVPGSSGVKHELTKEEKIRSLRDELNKAIEKQEYEKAAELRDKIKELSE